MMHAHCCTIYTLIAAYNRALMAINALCENSCVRVSREPIDVATFRLISYISGSHPDTNPPPVMTGFPVGEKK